MSVGLLGSREQGNLRKCPLSALGSALRNRGALGSAPESALGSALGSALEGALSVVLYRERLAKGWRKVGEGLAKSWRRVGEELAGFPCTLHLCNSRGARLEERVCENMVVVTKQRCDQGSKVKFEKGICD